MLQQNTVKKFISENVAPGEIHLLVSGALGGLAIWNNQTGTWNWPGTGSWKRNQIDETGEWVTPVEDVESNSGVLRKASLKGISVSILPKGSNTGQLEALKLCTKLKMDIRIGDSPSFSLNLNIQSKKLQGDYVFFEVDEELLPPDLLSNVDIYFKYYGEDYKGYTCYTVNTQDVTISLYPYVPPVESEEYNPILNNILQETVSTVARVVEPFEYRNIFLGTVETNADRRYNGWYADWNSSADYVQRLNGSGALWTPGQDPVIRVNAGGALGIYQMLPIVFLERGTKMADIPDYYFTSIANTSGRWLGTKNAEYWIYLGNKQQFTSKNLEVCKGYVEANSQRGELLVYQGSPFVVNSLQEDLEAGLSGSVNGTVLSGNISGSVMSGYLSGTVSGYVTNVPVDNRLTYYSSSVPMQDYALYTLGTESVSISGEGTRVLENSGKTIQAEASGLQKLESVYRFADIPVENQDIVVNFTNVSGSILGGKIFGYGNVFVPESEEVSSSSLFSCKDFRLTGTGLQVDNITSGEIYLVPSGSVNLSGTVGNVARNVTLHTFDGQLNVLAGNLQVKLSHADNLGVRVTDVETAEQSETVFDSFIADSLLFGDGFGGNAALDMVGGKVNISSNNLMMLSLLTEDQEEIRSSGSSATGSLHGVDLFMSKSEDGNPVWDLSTLRTQLDSNEFLPEGVALLSGSFDNFSLQGTRTMLRVFRYLRLSGSVIPQFDTVQASRLLSNLEAGVDFARLALFRSGTVAPSGLNPEIITRAQMPLRVYEAMNLSSNYVVSGAFRTEGDQEVPDTDPIWIDTGSILPPDFNFYETGSVTRARIIDFISGSETAISRLRSFMSGSRRTNIFQEPFGQYTYVCLNSSIPDYLEANIRDFSGSYTRRSGEEGNQAGGFLTGSFSKLWGRFGAGSIVQRRILETFQVLPTGSANMLSFSQSPLLPGISGVIYGAFDYRGYVDGGCEGNQVEGHLEGSIAGLVSGIVHNAHITGGPANIVGLAQGSFESTIQTGVFSGVMENISVEGNNLTDNLFLSGSITGVESLALQGTISGSVQQITLPEQCTFTITGSSEKTKLSEIFIPDWGQMTGQYQIYPERVGEVEIFPIAEHIPSGIGEIDLELTHSLDTRELSVQVYSGSSEILGVTLGIIDDSTVNVRIPLNHPAVSYEMVGTVELTRGLDWTSVLGKEVKINLAGETISENLIMGGTVSSSLSFGPEGRLFMPQVLVTDQVNYLETSTVSGQFAVSGNLHLRTQSSSLFSGEISPIPVSQSIQGLFDVNVERETYINANLEGRFEGIEGHLLLQGKVDLESGSCGNLVEGHDRPFFTLQGFSGSIFPVDTTDEAFLNMNISDMSISRLTFTSGMALVGYSSGSFGTIKEQEYIRNTLSLPQIGDIIFTGEGGKARVVSSKVYCPELHGVLTVNDRGTVIAVNYLG